MQTIVIPNTTNEIQQVLDETKRQEYLEREKNNPMTRNMNGLGTEYATSNRWIGYFPIQDVLGRKFENLEMNLTRFTVPQMNVGSATVSVRGYQYEIPTKLLDADNKEITVEYIVDSNWSNYKALFTWVSSMEGNINKVDDQTIVDSIKQNALIDCRVWLIDHYKNRIIDFVFHNCWIKQFGDLALESANTSQITHSFILAYSNYEIANAIV